MAKKNADKVKELDTLKKVMEEEKCNEKVRYWEYQIEREMNELKRKVMQWEKWKERKKIQRTSQRGEREEIRRVRVEEEERENLIDSEKVEQEKALMVKLAELL